MAVSAAPCSSRSASRTSAPAPSTSTANVAMNASSGSTIQGSIGRVRLRASAPGSLQNAAPASESHRTSRRMRSPSNVRAAVSRAGGGGSAPLSSASAQRRAPASIRTASWSTSDCAPASVSGASTAPSSRVIDPASSASGGWPARVASVHQPRPS